MYPSDKMTVKKKKSQIVTHGKGRGRKKKLMVGQDEEWEEFDVTEYHELQRVAGQHDNQRHSEEGKQ